MKINSQKREQNTVTIEVEVEATAFDSAIENALIQAGKEINFPGFRAGKAPREMVERAVNPEVLEHHAAQELVSQVYPEVVEKSQIEPVDYPKVEIVRKEKGSPFVFKVFVDVYPEIKLGKYKGIKVDKKPVKVEDNDVVALLGRLQERFAITSAEGKKELLPLDDDFAKRISRHGSLAELREEMREAMLKDQQAEAETDLKNKIVAGVAAEAKVEIPPVMVDREVSIMLDELRASLSQSNLTLEDYLKGSGKEEQALKDEMRKSAEIRVKGKIVLKAVAEAEKINVSQEELQVEIKALAASSGQDFEGFSNNLDEGGIKYVEDYLLRKKALDFLVEKAEIKEEDKQ